VKCESAAISLKECMSKEEIIQGITILLEDLIQNIMVDYQTQGIPFGNERYSSWRKRVTKFLDQHLPNEKIKFAASSSWYGFVLEQPFEPPVKSFWSQEGNQVCSYLHSLALDIEQDHYDPLTPPNKLNSDENVASSSSALEQVVEICNNFHKVVKQLRSRHDKRPTLEVNDEYDVQDLLHSLLHLHFVDVRPEECTPSNAAQCSRIDFLLKKESIVIEVKKTRNALTAKEVSSELIQDIHRYQSHPDCKTLVCFVYDPEERVDNPRGIERDLNYKAENFNVYVLIRPT
jgi:REase_DpnII-MboI